MQVVVCYDDKSIPTTYAYIGGEHGMWQSLSAVHKHTPKIFNIFEAKHFIELNHNPSTPNIYYTKPVKEIQWMNTY